MTSRPTRGRRRVLARTVLATLLVAAAAVLAACSSGSSGSSSSAQDGNSTTTVTLATSAFAGQVDGQILGLDPSICQPYGIKVNLVSASNAAAAAGLQNGSMDFALFDAVLTNISGGQAPGVIVLANTGGPPTNAGGIWAPPSITSYQQLVGKTLAGTGGGPDALTKMLMSSKGISSNQYTIVKFGNIEAYFAAPSAGQVTAAWDVAPLPPSWTAKDFHNVLPLSSNTAYTQDVYLTANKSFAESHKTVVENFLRCWAAGLQSNRSADAATLAKRAALVAKFNSLTTDEAKKVITAYAKSEYLLSPQVSKTIQSATFYLGSPANTTAVTNAVQPQYLKAAGVSVQPVDTAGPTNW